MKIHSAKELRPPPSIADDHATPASACQYTCGLFACAPLPTLSSGACRNSSPTWPMWLRDSFFAAGAPARASQPPLTWGWRAGLDRRHRPVASGQLARLVQRVEPVRVSDHAAFARYLRGTPSRCTMPTICCHRLHRRVAGHPGRQRGAGADSGCAGRCWWRTCRPICAGMTMPSPSRRSSNAAGAAIRLQAAAGCEQHGGECAERRARRGGCGGLRVGRYHRPAIVNEIPHGGLR